MSVKSDWQDDPVDGSTAADDDKKAKQKRSQACVSCRRQKMKCQFSHKSDPPRCDRCRQSNIECKFEIRANDKQWTASVEDRLKKLEDGLQYLMDIIQQNSQFGSPIAEGVWARQKGFNSSTSSTKDFALGSGGGRSSGSKDITNGLLSSIVGQTVESSPSDDSPRPAKRQKMKTEDDAIDRGLIDINQAADLIAFFNNKLARYLPILVFKYMPQFDISIRLKSPLLFVSVLSVASLYHDDYQGKHPQFRNEFEMMGDAINIDDETDLNDSIYNILALSLAGAWLGGELGFRMSLKASEVAGTKLPEVQNSLGPDQQARKEMLGAIGLMTYITEQRLRIIYARPVEPSQRVKGQGRDQFFAQFLESQMRHRKGHHEMDVAELKMTANVELCAIILTLQLDLYREIKMEIIAHWNNQLDRWLADWMGKLTVNLLPSSWKPVLLTFHFAKLFLNSLVVGNVKPGVDAWQSPIDDKMDNETRCEFLKTAEHSAMDILEMLNRDRDIQRLIGVGPVFYPTIFITASAFVLKLVAISHSVRYPVDESKLVDTVREAHRMLESKIKPILPCHPSVRNLGAGVNKVLERSLPPTPIGAAVVSNPNASTSPSSVLPPAPVHPPPSAAASAAVTAAPLAADSRTLSQPNVVVDPIPQGQMLPSQQQPIIYAPQQQQQQPSQAMPVVPDANLWSFTPYHRWPQDKAVDIDATIMGVGALQSAWQSGSNNTGVGTVGDFMMDAYSTSILDSLAGDVGLNQQDHSHPPSTHPM